MTRRYSMCYNTITELVFINIRSYDCNNILFHLNNHIIVPTLNQNDFKCYERRTDLVLWHNKHSLYRPHIVLVGRGIDRCGTLVQSTRIAFNLHSTVYVCTRIYYIVTVSTCVMITMITQIVTIIIRLIVL